MCPDSSQINQAAKPRRGSLRRPPLVSKERSDLASRIWGTKFRNERKWGFRGIPQLSSKKTACFRIELHVCFLLFSVGNQILPRRHSISAASLETDQPERQFRTAPAQKLPCLPTNLVLVKLGSQHAHCWSLGGDAGNRFPQILLASAFVQRYMTSIHQT